MMSDIDQCLAAYADGSTPSKDRERAAVKQVLAELVRRAPGKSVEVRIPPYAAIQVVEGVNHRRGTPAAIVETSARVLLQLARGAIDWETARRQGLIQASGERSDLSLYFPLTNIS